MKVYEQKFIQITITNFNLPEGYKRSKLTLQNLFTIDQCDLFGKTVSN